MLISRIFVKINFKCLFAIGIFGALLLIFGAYLGFTFIPNKIDEKVWETKILRENSEQWDIFMKIPFPLDFKVYLFNVQNPEEIILGAKPVVKEIGPYVYKLRRWKNEVEWNRTSDEISYYEYEKYEFDQEASGMLTENDMVTILNVPYNSFLFTAESLNPSLLSLINANLPGVFGENDGLFMKTKVKDFLFDGVKLCENGGESGFATKAICSQIKQRTKVAKQMRVDGKNIMFANFRFKNNTHQGYFTVKSGNTNKSDIANLVNFENKSEISTWLDEKSSCNKIGGITTVFPAKVESTMIFESFSEDICRSVKMAYEGLEMVQDIKGYRFVALNTTFNNSETFKENECFCINKTINLDGNSGCLFDGVSDLTNCKGAPVLVSFPHLLHADLRYVNSVEGLKPDKIKHETFVVLEPISGNPLKMAKRIQLNMFIRSLQDITALENITHSLLPFLWVEESTTLPQLYLDKIKYSLLRSLLILDIVRWTVIAVALAIICSSIFLFIYSQ
nr:sensory neuron membrane protein 2a [Pachyrhinus yasumatsui]